MTGAHTLNPTATLPPDAVITKRRSQRALQALAAVATLLLLSLAFVHFTQAPPERTVTRFSFAPDGLTWAQISPDGKYILYAAGSGAESSLWVRSLRDESARELPGTEGAFGGFWSPDSAWIGFGSGPGPKLKRISIDGGSPITLCELPGRGAAVLVGGTWSPDGERIVFSSGLRLYEVASRGGQPQLLFDPDDDPRPRSLYAKFLPTGSGPAALVYTAASSSADGWVAVLSLETGERRDLGPGGLPIYSPDGYLIHGPTNSGDRGLWALPFSLDTLETTGDAFPISTAGLAASVSHDGTLAYRDEAATGTIQTLVWRSRTGEMIEAVGQPPPNIGQVALSPDGQRAAVTSNESGNSDIWVHDLTRSTKMRFTFDDEIQASPVWSPSGQEIVYRHTATPSRLMSRAADGTGEPVVLVESGNALHAPNWSRDGHYLVYFESTPETSSDIRYIELGAGGSVGEPVTFLDSTARELSPKLSPDGRFLAYMSDESGRYEVYVRPFPNGDGKWQVSVTGGLGPRWSSDGSELYYGESGTLMAVSVSTESALTLGQPQPLFEASGGGQAGSGSGFYEVSADGQRFLTIAPVEDAEAPPPTIRIVQNWYEEFRDRER